MQILNSTRKNWGNGKGELKEHFLTVTKDDLNDTNINICWRNVKKLSQKILFLSLLISIYSLSSYAFDGRFEKRRHGTYRTSLVQDFQTGLGKIVIQKGNIKVFEEAEVDNHYYFGNHFTPNSNELADIFSGRDITGNGIANLVISNWTGGAHCCHFLNVFELGKKFKKLVTVEALSSSIRLVDLDHDGYPEIEFWDGAIDYQFACFAGSPGGRVVLKFQKDHYEVATHLMKKPIPTAKKIKRLKQNLIRSFRNEESPDLPYPFLKALMDLSYSGHFKLALRLADETWPSKKTGLEKFKSEFSQALRDSLYWKEF